MYKVEYTEEDTQGHNNLNCGGEQFPHKIETNKNMHRLYSHPLCPYAERARLVFRAKAIKHQIVNIDQRGKPDWFVAEGGAVPVIETPNGDLIPESDVAIEYANSISQDGIQILPSDPVQAAQLRVKTKRLEDGFMVPMYMGILKGEKEDIEKLQKKLKEVEDILSKNTEGNSYLFNQKDVTIADIYISPIFRRLWFFVEINDEFVKDINKEDYPHINKYLDKVFNHPDLAPAYGCKWGFINFVSLKRKDLSIKLPIPFDETSFEDSQSQNTIVIKDGVTAKPRVNENFIRIYGHPLCPFVMRALLALRAKKVDYQFVGVDLTHKNKWHMDINGGLVPFIETPKGEIVVESLDVSEWLNDYSKEGVELYPGDDTNKQKIKDSIKEWFENSLHFIMMGIKKELREGPVDDFLKKVEWANSNLPDSDGEIYINGESHETMADLMTLPFIHLLFRLNDTQLKEKFYDAIDWTKYSKLKKWYENLYGKYSEALVEGPVFSNWLNKNIEADGPKVQLFYPLLD